jgi:Mor family transcriptional regulator
MLDDRKTDMSCTRHEFLDDIASQIKQILIDNNVDASLAEQTGIDVSNHLSEHWGGQVFSVPKNHLFKITERDLAIFNEANRNNMHAVARKHGISVNAVYRALKRIRRSAISKSQPDMFN